MGLFDYLRKSRSHGFVVSISGGADSSAVACLVSLMDELAYRELGPEGFQAALEHIPGIGQLASHGDRMRRLLHCVYQAAANSSRTTRDAATAVANDIGAEMSCLEIDHLVRAYVEGMERVLGRKLTWDRDDLALQNIQARVRGPSVWLLANVKRGLAAGHEQPERGGRGLRHDGRRHLRGLEPDRRDRQGLPPAAGSAGSRPRALRVFTLLLAWPPSTAWRPPRSCGLPEAGQTDEDDLMPYPVLDAIERWGDPRQAVPPGDLPA